MQGRQLAAVFLCGLFLVPAPGVLAAGYSASAFGSGAGHVQDAAGVDADREGVYVPDDPDGETGDTGVEYAGIAVVGSDGTIRDTSTLGPGDHLRIEVTIPGRTGSGDSEYIPSSPSLSGSMEYPIRAEGVPVELASREGDNLTEGRFSSEPVLAYTISYAELDSHRDAFSDGFTFYVQAGGTWDDWAAAPRIDHFDLAEESDDGGVFAGLFDAIDAIRGADGGAEGGAEGAGDGSGDGSGGGGESESSAESTGSGSSGGDGGDGGVVELTMLSEETDADIQPVNIDDPIRVTVAVENTGEESVTRDVELFLNETERVGTRSVTLAPGENKSVEMTHRLSLVRDREIPVRVVVGEESARVDAYVLGLEPIPPGSAGNGSDDGGSRVIGVESPQPTTATLQASLVETNAPVRSGQDLTVTVSVTNPTGDRRTDAVGLRVGDGEEAERVARQNVTLRPGEVERVTFDYATAVRETDHVALLSATVWGTTTDSQEVTIRGAGAGGESDGEVGPRVSIVETNAPVTSGEYLGATIRVENPHERSISPTVRLIAGPDTSASAGEQVDARTVSLQPGEVTSIRMGYETPVRGVGKDFPLLVYSDGTSDPLKPGADGQSVRVRANLNGAGGGNNSESADG